MYVYTNRHYASNEPPVISTKINTDGDTPYLMVAFNRGDVGFVMSADEARAFRDALSIALADLTEKEPAHA